MKDIRCIYRPYIPKVLLNGKRLKYNLSDESIFGNLNYSIKPDIIESINNRENYNFSAKIRPLKLIHIKKKKKKENIVK